MKKTILAISVVLIMFTSYFYIGGTEKEVEILGEQEFFATLKEPLEATFLLKGKTLNTQKMGQQLVDYTFEGWMSDTPYNIRWGRNISINDCNGCIGGLNGRVTPPTYDGEVIPLQEFVIQMIVSNGDKDTKYEKYNEWVMNAGLYTWKYRIGEVGKTSFIPMIIASRNDDSKSWHAYVESQ